MQREVVINVLEPGGAAAKDGRLAVGDQILAVSLSTITFFNKNIFYSIYNGVLKPNSITAPVCTAQVALYVGILRCFFFFFRLCTPKNAQLTDTSPSKSIETRMKKIK